MFIRLRIAEALSLASAVLGAQPEAPKPYAAPLRELPWGQLNILHSTDTHGWHGGHMQEPSYSADWGDYISFATHMRAKAEQDGVDLLLVDTGDRVEGNGLYDASNPQGKYTFDIVKHQKIDVICSGNHELYKRNSSENELFKTVPNFKGNYLASNLDIYDPDLGQMIPLAPRFKKFTTPQQGIRVVAFGFLFNFRGNANNTVVQPVEETIKEQWFQDAISDRSVDLFLVTGHVAIRSPEYDAIFKAIRSSHWDTPIAFIGGHTHIRDWKKYDGKSYALESGRYMETIGFMSVTGLSTEKKTNSGSTSGVNFRRRYIDNNLYSYHHHTGLNESTFPTELGMNVTKQITQSRSELGLDRRHGCAPQNYWVNRAEMYSESSIFTWLDRDVLPTQLQAKSENKTAKIVLSNTGALRFDVFKGPFTKDSTYLISPFTSGFRYIKGVNYTIASKVLEVLNHGGPVLYELDSNLQEIDLQAPEQVGIRSKVAMQSADIDQSPRKQAPLKNKDALNPGYTTLDDDGNDGDDTIHSPIKFYLVPNCFQTKVDFPEGDNTPVVVDLVYNAFIENFILLALRFLGSKAERSDTADFMKGQTLTSVISDWVEDNWPCKN